MTNQHETARMFRGDLSRATMIGVLILGGATMLAGCGKKEEAPQEVAREPVAPARDPWEDIRLEPKVEFPREKAPSDMTLVKAAADLANALSKGDDQAMALLLGRRDRSVLADLVRSGEWKSQTGAIEVVRVCTLTIEDGKGRLGLGVQDSGGAYLLAFEAENQGGSWVFAGLAAEPRSAAAARDLDGAELKVRTATAGPAVTKPASDRPKPDSEVQPASQPVAVPTES